MATALFILQICIVLCLVGVILLQKTGSDGLSGLSGGGHNFLSNKVAGGAFSKLTMFLATAFMLNSLALAKLVIVDRQKAKLLIESIAVEQAKNIQQDEPPQTSGDMVPVAK